MPRTSNASIKNEVSGDTFKSITVSTSHDNEGFLSGAFRRQVQQLTYEITQPESGSRHSPHKLYVSRSLASLRLPWYRVMLNEEEVEREVRKAGFTVVCPEALSFKEQMKMFAGAKLVMGPSGSGMFNVIFAASVIRVVDIETFHVTVRQHGKLYASCGADYAFLFSQLRGNEHDGPVIRPSICPLDLLDQAIGWLTGEYSFSS